MHRKIPRTVILGMLATAAAVASVIPSASADTLTKTNGQSLTGRVVGEEKDVVVFEANLAGMLIRQRVPRSQIKSLQQEVREGPGYVALPVFGEIGVEVTGENFKRAVDEAKRHKPKYVILVIDSLGGSVREKERIVDVIRQTRDVRFVAYVKQAVSAAAIIALACPDIYVADEATIGATVTVTAGAFGQMRVAEEKIQSVVRATDRAVALGAGHSDLWVRGMSEKELELAVVIERGAARVVESSGRLNEQVIKRSGQILTLTGNEAVEYGLAKGACPSVEAIKDAMKLPAWHCADDQAWHLLANAAKAARSRREEARLIGPELRSLDARMAQATARLVVAEAALREVRKRRDAERKRVDDIYEKRMSEPGRGPSFKARIERLYAEAKQEVDDFHAREAARCEDEMRRAKADQQRLREERDTLISRTE